MHYAGPRAHTPSGNIDAALAPATGCSGALFKTKGAVARFPTKRYNGNPHAVVPAGSLKERRAFEREFFVNGFGPARQRVRHSREMRPYGDPPTPPSFAAAPVLPYFCRYRDANIQRGSPYPHSDGASGGGVSLPGVCIPFWMSYRFSCWPKKTTVTQTPVFVCPKISYSFVDARRKNSVGVRYL